MKKYRNLVITCLLLAAILALVYWWGGNGARMQGWTVEKPKAEHTMTAEKKVALAEEKSKEKAKTEPVTEEAPLTQPEEPVTESNELTCSISVRCDTILNNMDFLTPEKVGIVPASGIILAQRTVPFNEGETVFDVLLREMQSNNIHMEYTSTPMYDSVYIEGIANLYEFDCGELSGWMYRVNNWFPNYGCSRYTLKNGDKIEWIYTCDLGVDIGGFHATGNNR